VKINTARAIAMNNYKETGKARLTVICLSLFLIIITVLFTSACEPDVHVIVENQTYKTLTIYLVDGQTEELHGTIEPDHEITVFIPGFLIRPALVAKNENGEIVWSQTVTVEKEHQTDERTYKFVISQVAGSD